MFPPKNEPFRPPVQRFVAYGLLGCAAELVFTGLKSVLNHRDPGLSPHTSPWMFPIYGLMQPLYEPTHDRLRPLPTLVRAAAYGVGFHAVEYLSGLTLRRLIGKAPWDYSRARLNVSGLTRLDYFPLWAGFGLAMEKVHDRLVGRV